jgi:hypothetical protein
MRGEGRTQEESGVVVEKGISNGAGRGGGGVIT